MAETAQIFEIASSRHLRRVTLVVHLVAGVAVVTADLDGLFQALILCAVIASLTRSFHCARRIDLRCQPDGGLSLRYGGEWQAAELLPDTVVLAWLVVLRYRKAAGARPATIVVLPDSIEENDFRRLRVWLKWRAAIHTKETSQQS